MPSYSITYNRQWCKGCRICFNVCPRGVFEVEETADRDGYQKVRVAREESCTGCMLCEFLCPDMALEVKKC